MNDLQIAIQDYFAYWTNLFQFAVEIEAITPEEKIEKERDLQEEVDNLTFIAERDPDQVERYLQEFQPIQAQTNTALTELQPQVTSVNNLLTIRTALNQHFQNPAIRARLGNFNTDDYLDALTYHPGAGHAVSYSTIGIGTPTQLFHGRESSIPSSPLLSNMDHSLRFDYDGDGNDDLFLYSPRGRCCPDRSF